MLGESLLMWLHSLKIAIVEKNSDRLHELMDNLPQLQSQEEITSALILLDEAKQVIESLRDETALAMSKIKKSSDFLKSTQVNPIAKLDISS